MGYVNVPGGTNSPIKDIGSPSTMAPRQPPRISSGMNRTIYGPGQSEVNLTNKVNLYRRQGTQPDVNGSTDLRGANTLQNQIGNEDSSVVMRPRQSSPLGIGSGPLGLPSGPLGLPAGSRPMSPGTPGAAPGTPRMLNAGNPTPLYPRSGKSYESDRAWDGVKRPMGGAAAGNILSNPQIMGALPSSSNLGPRIAGPAAQGPYQQPPVGIAGGLMSTSGPNGASRFGTNSTDVIDTTGREIKYLSRGMNRIGNSPMTGQPDSPATAAIPGMAPVAKALTKSKPSNPNSKPRAPKKAKPASGSFNGLV